MEKKLTELLKGKDTLESAFEALTGKELIVEDGLPNPPQFKILVTKSDYFIGEWKDIQFFCKYKMKKVFSIPK